MQTVVVLLLASVIFFSSALLAAALLMRGQWDKIGERQPARPRSDSNEN